MKLNCNSWYLSLQAVSDLIKANRPLSPVAAIREIRLQGMAEYKGDIMIGTEISDPVPGEHAFDADDQVGLVRGDEL